MLLRGISGTASAKESSKGSGEMRATLTGGRICALGTFVVVAASSNTIVVVSGFGAASGNGGRHRLLLGEPKCNI